MRVSQKTDYALRAMLDLAINAAPERPARNAEVARRARVPEKFLEAILVDLRKANLVSSRRGPEGGHCLARPASAISAGAIREAIEGPLVLQASTRRAGEPASDCIKQLWAEVAGAIAGVLDETSLEDLARRAAARRNVPDFSI